jgi:hypothetical protein
VCLTFIQTAAETFEYMLAAFLAAVMQRLTVDLSLLCCSKACAMLKHTLEWRKENKIGTWQANTLCTADGRDIVRLM